MDIKQAKEALRRTYLVYTERDEFGSLRIPAEQQRPLLLMGPPGVGKTAILSQLAEELGAGLVAYTMTHHTRQSAIGLPLIREKTYGGKTCSATEYTMSEILASIYDQMEQTGQKTGFLFLDEINCVSETLVPAMLQLLQKKEFGKYRVPEGWVIAAAGNPPEYNGSARRFDAATMDRVRLIEVEADYAVWRTYALSRGVHPAVMSFLELEPERFYRVEPHGHGAVTARGWEDLSTLLSGYERLGFPIEDAVFGEFLQEPETAAAFTSFFRIFTACRAKLDVEGVLSGVIPCAPELRKLRFDERLAMVEFLLHALGKELETCCAGKQLAQSLTSFCGAAEDLAAAKEHLARREHAVEVRIACGAISAKERAAERIFCAVVSGLLRGAENLDRLRQEEARRRTGIETAEASLWTRMEHAAKFVRKTFGAGQELLIFLTQLESIEGGQRIIKESREILGMIEEVGD